VRWEGRHGRNTNARDPRYSECHPWGGSHRKKTGVPLRKDPEVRPKGNAEAFPPVYDGPEAGPGSQRAKKNAAAKARDGTGPADGRKNACTIVPKVSHEDLI